MSELPNMVLSCNSRGRKDYRIRLVDDSLPLTKILIKYFDSPHRNLPDCANWYPGLVTHKLCSCFCLWQIQVQLKILQSEKDTIKSLACVFMISKEIQNLTFCATIHKWSVRFSYCIDDNKDGATLRVFHWHQCVYSEKYKSRMCQWLSGEPHGQCLTLYYTPKFFSVDKLNKKGVFLCICWKGQYLGWIVVSWNHLFDLFETSTRSAQNYDFTWN